MFLLTKTASWRINMFRLWKALPLTLAVAALSSVATSCGSGSARVRVVNAIPDNGSQGAIALDIDINGTKDFPSVQFDTVYPTQTTPASYVSVPSGSDTIIAYDAGTTTNPVVNSNTASLGGSTQYTMLLGGFSAHSPQPYLITDTNTVPTAGNLEIRVINGSAVSAQYGGIDVYVYQNGLQPPTTPQISGLNLGQGSSYLSLTYESNYCIDFYLHGTGTKYTGCFAQGGSSTAGQITTLVIVDLPGGGAISPTPLEMVDLN